MSTLTRLRILGFILMVAGTILFMDANDKDGFEAWLGTVAQISAVFILALAPSIVKHWCDEDESEN